VAGFSNITVSERLQCGNSMKMTGNIVGMIEVASRLGLEFSFA